MLSSFANSPSEILPGLSTWNSTENIEHEFITQDRRIMQLYKLGFTDKKNTAFPSPELIYRIPYLVKAVAAKGIQVYNGLKRTPANRL